MEWSINAKGVLKFILFHTLTVNNMEDLQTPKKLIIKGYNQIYFINKNQQNLHNQSKQALKRIEFKVVIKKLDEINNEKQTNPKSVQIKNQQYFVQKPVNNANIFSQSHQLKYLGQDKSLFKQNQHDQSNHFPHQLEYQHKIVEQPSIQNEDHIFQVKKYEKVVQNFSQEQNNPMIITQQGIILYQKFSDVNKTKYCNLESKILSQMSQIHPFMDHFKTLKASYEQKQSIYQEDNDDSQSKQPIIFKSNPTQLQNCLLAQPLQPDNKIDLQQMQQQTFIQNLKCIFQLQKKKNSTLIDKFNSRQYKTKHSDKFGKMMTHMLIIQNLRGKLYNSLMQELCNFIDKLIKSLLTIMTERQIDIYKQIVNDLRNNIDKPSISKFKQFNPQGFTIEKAFKLDVLSYFFKKNHDKQQQYGFLKAHIVWPNILSRLLKVNTFQTCYYGQRFDQLFNWLEFEYASSFDQLASLLYLIDIKHRITYRKIHLAEGKKQRIKKTSLRKIAQSNPNKTNYKYKFCLLANLQPGQKMSSYNPIIKTQIYQKMQSITQIDSFPQRQTKIIKIKIQHNLNLKDLSEIEMELENKDKKIKNKLQNQISVEQKLQKFKWIFLKQKSFATALKNITGIQLKDNEIYERNTFITKNMIQMAMERFKYSEKILETQINVIERYTSTKFIYIHRLQYCYSELRKYFNIERHYSSEQQKDQINSLIVGATKDKIYFYCFLRGDITERDYNKIIKSIFTQYLKPKFQFSIVIYEHTIEKGCYNRKFYTQLREYFKKAFKSNVYISNSPQRFRIHFIIDYIIKCYFKNRKINKIQFNKEITKKIIQTINKMQKIYQADRP